MEEASARGTGTCTTTTTNTATTTATSGGGSSGRHVDHSKYSKLTNNTLVFENTTRGYILAHQFLRHRQARGLGSIAVTGVGLTVVGLWLLSSNANNHANDHAKPAIGTQARPDKQTQPEGRRPGMSR